MKTLVSRKLKSDDKEEGTEDGRTSASTLLDIKGESEAASVMENLRVSMSGSESNELNSVDQSHLEGEHLGKEDDGGGLWKCEHCTLDNPITTIKFVEIELLE